MPLVDTHCHLDQEEFDSDRAEVIARAHAAGVKTIVTVGVTAESSAAAIQLANQHAGIYAAVGIHPNYCAKAKTGDWEQVMEM
ncbi:MAG TPA: TatD family hydrolase, partial [Pirellulales bacterium]